MSEFKLQSPPRQRLYLYVNPYTDCYEIRNIPTKDQVQHIGYYVGSFLSYHHLAQKDVYHITRYKIMDQSAMDKRYGEDGKRTNICFTFNKTGHWARNCAEKEKQTDTFVFVYVHPYSLDLKISPTMGPAKEFQHLKFVGVLKSFCNEYKINSPQSTISVESQTENMQIDNTSISDSEICETAEQMEKEITKSESNANQINSHLSSKKDLSTSEEKQQSNEEKKKKKELL